MNLEDLHRLEAYATATCQLNQQAPQRGNRPASLRQRQHSAIILSTTLRRHRRHREEWKRTQATLNRDDLLVTGKLLNWAHSAVNTAVSTNATPQTPKHPVSSQRYRNLEVAVWRRDGEEDAFYTVSLKRSYKVNDKCNDSTISLSNDDLLPMTRLLDRAHDAIDDLYEAGDLTSQESNNNGSSNSNDTPF